jgi:hypothetical protein
VLRTGGDVVVLEYLRASLAWWEVMNSTGGGAEIVLLDQRMIDWTSNYFVSVDVYFILGGQRVSPTGRLMNNNRTTFSMRGGHILYRIHCSHSN